KLVQAFKAEGLRVGTCKHDGAHEIAMDALGTDTWKHREAGADVTLIASRTQAAMQVFYGEQPSLERWLDQLSDPQLRLDLVVVEGWKHSDLPKIVLLGDEKIEQLSNVIGYAGDLSIGSIADPKVQVYDRDEISALVQLIKTRVLQDV
ncbi:MAG: molybdopterin-guanine dinucleotide biosynthesis protein B, partial [Tumebacillaceae bacterium]